MADRGHFNASTEWAWAQEIDNSGAKFVLLACAKYAMDKWSCFPSQETLAKLTGQGVRTVRRNLDYLERSCGRHECTPKPDDEPGTKCEHEPKPIERKHRFDEKGNRTSDLITLSPAANLAGSDQRPNRPVVKLAATPDQQELTSGQIGQRSDWPGKSFPTGKTEEKNTNKAGVGGSKGKTAKPKLADEHPHFAEWYRLYPLHKAPGAARKAFNAAIKKVDDAQVLLDAVKKYRDDPSVRRGFVAYPATWLNQERWLDEASLADTGTDGYSFENITETAGGYE